MHSEFPRFCEFPDTGSEGQDLLAREGGRKVGNAELHSVDAVALS